MTDLAFIQAKWYYVGRREPVELIVLHATQTKEWGSTAEGVARYGAAGCPYRKPDGSTGYRKASWHLVFDNDSGVQCVRYQDTAFGASGANANGIHVEHVGFSAQTREEWLDAFGQGMLPRSARHVRELCDRFSLPPVFLDVAAVRAKGKGVTTHAVVEKAFPSTGHTDPGSGFPMDYFLQLVKGDEEMPLSDEDKAWIAAQVADSVNKAKNGIGAWLGLVDGQTVGGSLREILSKASSGAALTDADRQLLAEVKASADALNNRLASP